jgi:hypothetical protein
MLVKMYQKINLNILINSIKIEIKISMIIINIKMMKKIIKAWDLI